MITIEFTVIGTPIAKGRPKFARRGKFVSTYSPKKTVDYANILADEAKVAMAGRKPMECALSVSCAFFMPIPASASKKKRHDMRDGYVPHVKRPDGDNLEKAVFDGLNGIAWTDDSQIVRCSWEKKYSDFPRVEIKIIEVCK